MKKIILQGEEAALNKMLKINDLWMKRNKVEILKEEVQKPKKTRTPKAKDE